MPAFRFNLQKVLDFRVQLVEQAQVALAQAQQRLREVQDRMDSIKQELANQEEKRYGEQATANGGERWLLDQYIRGLKNDLEQSQTLLNLCRRNVEQAKAELIERSKDKKVLEKLKEKQAARHAREELMLEQRTYDETNTLRYRAPSF